MNNLVLGGEISIRQVIEQVYDYKYLGLDIRLSTRTDFRYVWIFEVASV